MSIHHLTGLSPADLAILFEPNPYSYDSTITDPSLPPSPFVQAMREQEDLFFAAFPEAKKAAQLRERRKQQLRAFLASRDATTRAHNGQDCQLSPPLTVSASPIPNHTHIYGNVLPTAYYDGQPDSHLPPRQHSLHRIDEELKPKPEARDTFVSSLIPVKNPTPQPQPQQQQPHSPTLHDRHPKEEEEHDSGSQRVKPKPASTISRDRGDRLNRSSKPRPSTPKPPRNKNPKPKRRVGSIPRKRQPHQHQLDGRKPTLACLFCRGRKIACGAPLPGSIGKTCNQCQRRSLLCEFPPESRRGMKRSRTFNGSDEDQDFFESILSP